MKEKEGNRKYKTELGISMVAVHARAFRFALDFAKPMENGVKRGPCCCLLPVIPMALAVWAMARHVRADRQVSCGCAPSRASPSRPPSLPA